MSSSSRFPQWVSRRRSAEGLLVPALTFGWSEPWRRAKMDSGRVSTYSSFARSVWQHRALVMGPGVLICIQQGRKPVLVPQASSSMSR